MLTFKEFREAEGKKHDLKALEVVRKGMNLQRGADFWDDFLSLCGNSEGMAALLNIPRENITGLGGRINKLKKEIEPDKKETRKNSKIIKTGDKI